LTDQELIQEIQNGNEEKFEELLNKHVGTIYNLTKNVYFRDGDKEDVIQEAKIAFYIAALNYNGESKTTSHFCNVVRKRLNTQITRCNTKKQMTLNEAQPIDKPLPEGGSQHDLIPSKELTPLEQVIEKENEEEIRIIIQENLTEIEKGVMIDYIDGLSYRGISARTGYDYKRIDNAIARAKRKLREALK